MGRGSRNILRDRSESSRELVVLRLVVADEVEGGPEIPDWPDLQDRLSQVAIGRFAHRGSKVAPGKRLKVRGYMAEDNLEV